MTNDERLEAALRYASREAKPTRGSGPDQREYARTEIVRICEIGGRANALRISEALSVYDARCEPPWGAEFRQLVKDVEQRFKGADAALIKFFAEQERARQLVEDQARELAQRARRQAGELYSNKIGTWSEIAAALKVSPRHVQSVASAGTTSRSFAAKLARHLNCEPRALYRRPVRRGRKRHYAAALMRLGEAEFTFRSYVAQMEKEDRAWIWFELVALYQRGEAPDNFDSLEMFQNFAGLHGLEGWESAHAMGALWKRFKCWRIECVARQASFEVVAELELSNMW